MIDTIDSHGTIKPAALVLFGSEQELISIGRVLHLRIVLYYSGGVLEATEVTFFEALRAVRRTLDQQGILLVCYGASRNVHSGGLAAEMGDGSLAFKLRLGEEARVKDLVYIFDTGPDVEPTTVADQDAFTEEWRRSRARP